MIDLNTTLANIPIFNSLSQTDINRLAKVVNLVDVGERSILLREGETGDRFYVILSGQVEIIKALGTPEESMLGIREPGDYLGEMSLLNWDGRRTASARALESVKLIEITREQFDDLVKNQPKLVYAMVREMSTRLTRSQEQAIQVLQKKNEQLQRAYDELKLAQAQLIEKEKIERELQLAREIQLSILPRNLPCVSGYDLGALVIPARAVGGDFFDVFPLDKKHLGVLIGDVSDKGVPAAIYMAQTRALLRAKAGAGISPAKTLRMANQVLLDTNDSGMFVTVLYGSLNLETGELEYARAGHEVPILLNKAGESRALPYNPGLPLGIMDQLVVDQQSIRLHTGDLLFLYTDGVTDGLNLGTDAVGTETLEPLVRAGNGFPAQDFCTHISQAVNQHQGDQPQVDDVTLLAIRAADHCD